MLQIEKVNILNKRKEFKRSELPMLDIIDAPCGTGKTTYAINKINGSDDRVIFVTPFLSEVNRIEKACSRIGVYNSSL